MQDDSSQKVARTLLSLDQKIALLQELHLDALPEERQQELSQMMVDLVLGNVFERVSAVLTEDDVRYLGEMANGSGEGTDAVVEYIRSKVPNFDTILTEEIEKFKSEVKGNVAAMISEMDTD